LSRKDVFSGFGIQFKVLACLVESLVVYANVMVFLISVTLITFKREKKKKMLLVSGGGIGFDFACYGF
jgi:hypothetical protein